MLKIYIITILAMTFITTVVYSYDFSVAVGQWERYHRPRIPEYILLMLSALGGGAGAWITMKVQRHKSSKEKWYFHFVSYFSMIINLITFAILFVTEIMGG